MKELSEFTEKKYRIVGQYGVRLLQGQITRNEGGLSMALGTKVGVRRLIAEMNPFIRISITEIATKKDITSEFADVIQLCGSRHNQPVRVSNYL